MHFNSAFEKKSHVTLSFFPSSRTCSATPHKVIWSSRISVKLSIRSHTDVYNISYKLLNWYGITGTTHTWIQFFWRRWRTIIPHAVTRRSVNAVKPPWPKQADCSVTFIILCVAVTRHDFCVTPSRLIEGTAARPSYDSPTNCFQESFRCVLCDNRLRTDQCASRLIIYVCQSHKSRRRRGEFTDPSRASRMCRWTMRDASTTDAWIK